MIRRPPRSPLFPYPTLSRSLAPPPATPTPKAAAVQTPTGRSTPRGSATTLAASPPAIPATSGAAGLRTASTKRSRRRTKFRVATNPPPSAAAPINKPTTMVHLPCRAPYATCASAVSAATVSSDPASRGVMMTRIATATAVVLGLLSACPLVRLPAQSLRVPYQTFTLPNGLQVIVHEDHSVPVVAVNTWYHVGSSDEKPGRTGFAHLFEHIMFMGSQHVPTGEFDRLLEAAGADNNGSTTEDRTNYRSEEHTSELQSRLHLVCRLLLEK